MSEAETTAAIEAIKAELGAAGMKDMGRVMAELKARHGSRLDMSKASGLVKDSAGLMPRSTAHDAGGPIAREA